MKTPFPKPVIAAMIALVVAFVGYEYYQIVFNSTGPMTAPKNMSVTPDTTRKHKPDP